jgi:heat shock protein HtpX
MERKALGRELGLTVRISAALAFMAIIYLGGEALFLATAIKLAVDGAYVGALIALLFAAAITAALVIQLMKSATAALRATHAVFLAPHQEPDLQELVARMATMADLPAPRVARVASTQANAFSVGMSPQRAVLVVTTALLHVLDHREQEAVVAHELGHIASRDGAVVTFMSGPSLLGSLFWREGEYAGKVLVLMVYWPIHVLSLVLTWVISRSREYVADRGAALLTGAPETLMSALVKLDGRGRDDDLRGGAAVSALCIVPTKRAKGRLDFLRRSQIFSNHPSVESRLRELSELAGELGRPAR